MRTNICPICVSVSALWLGLSAGIAWGYLLAQTFIIPIALLMGGTVVGIAYLGEKRCRWASQHPQKWKTSVIFIGMPIAYLLVVNLTKFIVVAELSILLVIAYFLFVKQSRQVGTANSDQSIRVIKEKIEQCC